MHTGSRIESANGDFLARLPPPHDVNGIQETHMRQWVELHARRKDQPEPTPFLSVTTQLLRAISLAEHFRMWGHQRRPQEKVLSLGVSGKDLLLTVFSRPR